MQTGIKAISFRQLGSSNTHAHILQVYDFMQKDAAKLPIIEQPDSQERLSRIMKSKALRPNKVTPTSYNKTYVPCNHLGPCDAQTCLCVQTQNSCEKFCNCSSDCCYRFPGCKCKGECKGNNCTCYVAARECDPDLCGSCGANSLDVKNINCKNVSIQHNLRKYLLAQIYPQLSN